MKVSGCPENPEILGHGRLQSVDYISRLGCSDLAAATGVAVQKLCGIIGSA